MIMEPRHDEFSDYINSFSLDDESILPIFGQSPGLANGYRFREEPLDLSFLEAPNREPNSGPYTSDSSSRMSTQVDSPDDFSDCVVRYINQILVEEDMEAKQSMFHDPLALQATEESFYEALVEKYPPSNVEIPEENLFSSASDYSTNSSNSNDSQWPGGDSLEAKSSSFPQTHSLEYPLLSSFGSTTSVTNDGFSTLNSMVNTHIIENIFTDNESILQFNRGMEEASKFLPPSKPILIDLDKYNLPSNPRQSPTKVVVKEENVETKGNSFSGFRGRKKYHREDTSYEEERSSKQSAVFEEEVELCDMFDRIVSCTYNECSSTSVSEEPPKPVVNKKLQQNGHAHRYTSGWIDRSWGGSSGEPTDVRTLLVNCAQSVATDDYITANEQLNQIRQHASPSGDAPQRLAHIFANGLEARLAGIGSHLYMSKSTIKISASEKLKAYQSYISSCPFKKIAIFFAGKMIYDAASTHSTLHIVDFGIAYGCQWPILIKHLSERPGGPPKLRFTGIDLPDPGFRPSERVEETGRRLANYCARFNVPFEYNAIAIQNWELIKIEDLKLQRNECLAVNNLISFKNLHDDSVMESNPRDGVLKLIRDMKPDMFVQTVVNGSYSSPFFVTRFKEALFHFSSMFDMFDATLDRDDEERLNFEREFCGREALNVIACEGGERVERPETYKQWQARNLRAGFKIKPLERAFVSKLRGKVKAGYHKDFVFDDDGKWVLQGWKGRILRATSCWVPA
ncbi:scarecrow-like protein 14 [Lactuca sativa]|uniref:scarecrow-like protein 14 n=1 Tax=Lactuca sativa TaxID=4236 RepID=UPI000CB8C3C5|nr:scarecrow-like protein 14 [Lactuca sativa]XP_023758829.1 scarecrow-like protein 14 [Lactuca sativa]XP_023758832.1 scarecrow-like protein 14 [Lactuca sativa]XP_023758833.1 scarecrow-like protein 14 [Lactuca sativa]XP_023758834.1 scarecrow-like protein 14 [Lactuca sativa]XP_052619649.1 scarecrow-like protein 14 [Lactuca sativa]